MKKIILTSAIAMAIATGAGAKTADQLRVYINPGHGSWTANDRPCTLVNHPKAYTASNTDTLSFFESNTDLQKGFAVMERLIDAGLKFNRSLNQTGNNRTTGAARDLSNNVVMSRVKNGPYSSNNTSSASYATAFNRNLSEICTEVKNNNFDMFISIHSNAATEGTNTNYPIFLYRGYDTPKSGDAVNYTQQTNSRKMCTIARPYIINNPHFVWTNLNASVHVRGDCNFYYGSLKTEESKNAVNNRTYAGYLGALKHSTPGYLSEGYFHTYQPARHRAMNWDVCYVEGDAYARGVVEYFGLQPEKTGTIYGIVRDRNTKFTDTNYKPNSASDDIYKPLNGAKVTLYKDGTPIKTYTTDGYYNGCFVFRYLEPGTYTIQAEHADCGNSAPMEVVVKANADTYPKVFLDGSTHEVPVDPELPVADSYDARVEYADEPIKELEGKIVRRAIVNDNKMYILAIDKLPTYAQVVADADKPVPTILVYDLKEQAVLANLSTKGTSGSIQNVADIQLTDDGYLIATNQTKVQYDDTYREDLPDGTKEPRGVLNVYKWNNDKDGIPTGDPQVWLSHKTQAGRWYRAYGGNTFVYSGTTDNGQMIVCQPNIGAPEHKFRATRITVQGGSINSTKDINSPNTEGEAVFGADVRYTLNVHNPANFLIAGSKATKQHTLEMGDAQACTAVANSQFNNTSGTIGMFRYSSASYVVAPEYKDGKTTGVRLINIADGINAATGANVNASVAAAASTNVATGGEVNMARDEITGEVTSAWMDLYLLRDGKISKFTTRTFNESSDKREFAYELDLKEGQDGKCSISFKVTGDVPATYLVLTNVEDEEDVREFELGPAFKGSNKFVFDATSLEEDSKFAWSVRVHNNTLAESKVTAANKDMVGTGRGAVVCFTDPTTEMFGHMVICRTKNGGFDIYSPDGTKMNTTPYHKENAVMGGSAANTSCPMQGTQRGNEVVVASWGDAAYGVVAFDAAHPETAPYSVFQGTKASDGTVTNGAAKVGSGTPAVAFAGTDENTVMFTFDEDIFNNHLALHRIGTAKTVGTAAEDLGFADLLANTRVGMAGTPYGVFVTQNRENGMDKDVTALGFINLNGEKVFGIGDMAATHPNLLANSSSGVAVNKDNTLVAVSTYTGVDVFHLNWDENHVPDVEKYYSITTKPRGTTHVTMNFDYADNLHIIDETIGYYRVALAGTEPEVTTPAPANSFIVGTTAEEPPTPPTPSTECSIDRLTEKWNYSENAGTLGQAAWFNRGAPTRDMCFAKGHLYVLNTGAGAPAELVILDAYTLKEVGQLSKKGISGGTFNIGGLKTLGTTVIGANMVDASGELKVYKWTNDNSDPEVILSTTDHGGVQVGRTFNTYGDMNDGRIVFGFNDTNSKIAKIVYYNVRNGSVDPTPHVIDHGVTGGNASNIHVIFQEDGSFILIHKDTHPALFSAEGKKLHELTKSDMAGQQYGVGGTVFNYGGHKYLAATVTLGSSAYSAWGNGAMRLLDITDGFSNPKPVESLSRSAGAVYPAEGLGSNSFHNQAVNTVAHEVTEGDRGLNLWVMVPQQGIAMYSHENPNTGVEDIVVDEEEVEAPVEWYTLGGIRVSGDNLTPGIYIRRQGTKTTKIMIK